MESIVKALFPVVFIVAMGWLAGWRKIIDAKHAPNFATYVMNFSFPCLLFFKISTSHINELFNGRFIGGFAVGLLGMYVLMYILNRYIYGRSISDSCQTSFICSFPNMAFMGIPILTSVFNEQAVIAVVIGNIITSLVMIPVTVAILEFSRESQIKTNVMHLACKVFTKPLVLAPIIGIIFSGLGIKPPALILDSLKMFGSTTSGVSLFTLGLILSANKVYFNRYMLSNIFCKNCLHPIMMYGIVLAFGISGLWAKEAILLCAMPSAVTATMFAVKYDVLKAESSSSALISTLLSLLSLAFVMYLLNISNF